MPAFKFPSDLPKLKAAPTTVYSAPKQLKFSEEVREHLQAHIREVGVDKHRYKHTVEEQSM